MRLLIVLLSLLVSSPLLAQKLEVEGDVDVKNNQIKNVGDPTASQDAVTKSYVDGILSNSTGNYGTVVNPITGKVWLDRNLGATQVANSSTDTSSYGDLYQWGRGADEHQVRTSPITNIQATNWLAGGGTAWDSIFITSYSNWLSTGEIHMWTGVAAENNPCPSGFRIPTNAEWEQERLSWSSDAASGAYASPLKLPMAGLRFSDGLLGTAGSLGNYWSSTVSEGGSRQLFFDCCSEGMATRDRAYGCSVRCIKN